MRRKKMPHPQHFFPPLVSSFVLWLPLWIFNGQGYAQFSHKCLYFTVSSSHYSITQQY